MKYIFLLLCVLFGNSLHGQDLDSPKEISLETSIEQAGDIGQFVPAAFSLALIAINKDDQGMWQFAKAMGANLLITYTVKHAINKPRPEGRLDGHAFPSGHTSFAFQGASFVQQRYGWSYGIPAYIIAGFVAYSRLEGINDRHDGWDVLGGIITGVGSTYLFTTPYARDHFEMSFDSLRGDYLIGLKFKF